MANTYSNKLGNNGGRFYDFLNRPVLIDCNFIVDSSNGNGLGIRSLKGAGVQNVFMYTSQTPGKGANNYLNPNPAAGYALIQLQNNYNRYAGGFSGFVAPTIGSTKAINGSALTAGNPYVIATVGHAAAGAVTIAPVADVSGSLASTYFTLFDAYGNTFVIWFSVSGVGSAPNLGVAAPYGTQGLHYVQQSISTGDTAGTIGTALATTIAALPSGVASVFSFTTSGSTTVTVTSTQTNPYGPLPGAPQDGMIPTGFTFAQTVYRTNNYCWRQVGLPDGITPAVGAAFIATAAGFSTNGSSTGTVIAPGVSGISSIEVVGDPNQMLAPIPRGGSPNVGGWVLVQFMSQLPISFTGSTHTTTTVDTLTPSNPITAGVRVGMGISGAGIPLGTTVAAVSSSAITLSNAATATASGVAMTVGPANVPTAPIDGSVVGMSFVVEAGSILIAGE